MKYYFSAAMVNSPENRLKKGNAYHWDLGNICFTKLFKNYFLYHKYFKHLKNSFYDIWFSTLTNYSLLYTFLDKTRYGISESSEEFIFS